jgi:hypothetical protein
MRVFGAINLNNGRWYEFEHARGQILGGRQDLPSGMVTYCDPMSFIEHTVHTQFTLSCFVWPVGRWRSCTCACMSYLIIG